MQLAKLANQKIVERERQFVTATVEGLRSLGEGSAGT
jgi:hypothetical protein